MDLNETDEDALGAVFDQFEESDDVQHIFTNARGYEDNSSE